MVQELLLFNIVISSVEVTVGDYPPAIYYLSAVERRDRILVFLLHIAVIHL